MYLPNFAVENKTFCLSLHYNGDNSYLFVNGKQVINFKAKDSEIKAYQLCLGNISKDFSASGWEDTGLYGNVYDFSVDYSAITNDKILDIHNYLECALECASIKNQECKARTKIIDVNSNEPVFYPFSIKVNKCGRSCKGINDPYAKLCVPDIIKNTKVRVFNLMSRINET